MTDSIDDAPRSAGQDIDVRRYRKVRRFILGVVFQTLWWDLLLNRPVLRRLRPDALGRWRRTARRFRSLAVELGGVLIKLGQFLSIRVDILPVEITRELAGLQDEVPPAPTEAVLAQIAEDFQRPPETVFPEFDPVPLGAASLSQAHRVRLPGGERAVAKVLRPGIHTLVETDLAAIRIAFRWLRHYPGLPKRVDLDWLYTEFAEVTRRELDLDAERENLERLREDFAGDPGFGFPRVFPEQSRGRTLTLEDVGFIRIADRAGMAAAGVSPPAVADRLYTGYMRQVFETFFVHVDPHPGNLFVRPLPTPEEAAAGTAFGPGDPVPHAPDRPFRIMFVDFGMATPIPERLRAALRKYAVGLGTGDAHLLVQSLVDAGTLLPDADLKRLEDAHQALFDRFRGVQVGRLKDVALESAKEFLRDYRDVIQSAPFQFQADMLFVVRAIGILSGLAAHLDPDFDVWAKTLPYAERYAKEELRSEGLARLGGLARAFRAAAALPEQMERLLRQAERADLTVRTGLTPELRHRLGDMERSVDRLGWMVLAAGLGASAVLVYGLRPESPAAPASAAMALAAFLRGRLGG
jgi:predicted unusual protein kinase regulating ubiquinone biosynthesis (AarF/ABC1/UbiB family)